MRQQHETELNPEQITRTMELARAQADKQQKMKNAQEDYALRVRCVEQAIRAIDALPHFNVPISAPAATNITNNFQVPDVELIARKIYSFVTETANDE